MKWWKWWNKQPVGTYLRPSPRYQMPKVHDNPLPPVLTGMTRERWTAGPEAAQRLSEVIRLNPVVMDAISVLWSELPRGYPARGIQINGETAAHELGRMNGWMSCIDLLESLTKWVPPKEPLQATYAETLEDQLAAQEAP